MIYFKNILIVLLLFYTICFSFTKPQTALEKSEFKSLTSYNDMIKYLEELAASNSRVRLKEIGTSTEGKIIPALFFSEDEFIASRREEKPLVMIYAQQHGNEPSGKEASLIAARILLNDNSDILKHLDLILVPQVNPDGAEKGIRRNANDMDLNRNHVILSEPESIALHKLFLRWMPEVTLDIHESNAVKKNWIDHGYIKDADEMLGTVTNLNISKNILYFSKNTILKEVGEIIHRDGYRFHEYVVGSPFKNKRIRYSTTNINDGRQSMGIYNTLSFLVEGKRYGDLTTNIERRTKAQVSAIFAFLRSIVNHQTEILKIVRTARNDLLNSDKNQRVYLQMDYFPDSDKKELNFPIFDLYSWHHKNRNLSNFEPALKIKKSIKRPYAYIFSERQTRLLDLLKKHSIVIKHLVHDQKLKVSSYKILHVTPTIEEDKSGEFVDVDINNHEKKFLAGAIVIPVDQKASNLIPLLLEPQSSWGIVTERSGRKYRFKEFIKEGEIYPIFRIETPELIDAEEIHY